MLPSTGQELDKCTDASGNQIQAEGKILPCCTERNWCSYVWEFTQILIQEGTVAVATCGYGWGHTRERVYPLHTSCPLQEPVSSSPSSECHKLAF